MSDTDERKPPTPAELIAQLERSNATVIAQALSNDAQIHVARTVASTGLVASSLGDGAVAMSRSAKA